MEEPIHYKLHKFTIFLRRKEASIGERYHYQQTAQIKGLLEMFDLGKGKIH